MNEHDSVGLIDFHTHILPCMDDGSRSADESVRMLRESTAQNVDTIVLTPHFYAAKDNPSHFLQKREKTLSQLRERWQEPLPRLIPAAEVAYFEGITQMQELLSMRMGTSRGLLIEMPQQKWTNRVVNDILDLNSRSEYRVIIAHIERYAQYQDDAVLNKLVHGGVLMQANAEFFCSFFTASKAKRLLTRGHIHLLGSDCHNMTSRPPVLRAAVERIRKSCGQTSVLRMIELGRSLLAETDEVNAAR